jgi:hypothetical protein
VNPEPTDRNSIAFGRPPGHVLNVVYLTPEKANKGGFFPRGVNGDVRQSSRLTIDKNAPRSRLS